MTYLKNKYFIHDLKRIVSKFFFQNYSFLFIVNGLKLRFKKSFLNFSNAFQFLLLTEIAGNIETEIYSLLLSTLSCPIQYPLLGKF